jgi:hypothetical protein
VGSVKSDTLKFPNSLCHDCNTTRSQPYDRAWERLSSELRNNPVRRPGTLLRTNRLWYDARNQMLNVHLFFCKIFGCDIIEKDLPIDIAPFARALRLGKAHPDLYLAFGYLPNDWEGNVAGRTDLHMATDRSGKCASAAWIYFINQLSIIVTYATADYQNWQGLKGSWHPRYSTTKIALTDFTAWTAP